MASAQIKRRREIEVKSSSTSNVRPNASGAMSAPPTQTSQNQDGSWNPFPGDSWTLEHITNSSGQVTITSSIFPGMLPAQTSPPVSSNKPLAMSRRQKTATRPSGTAGLGCDADEQRMIDQYLAVKKGPGANMKVAQTQPKKPHANGRKAKSSIAKPRQKHSNTNANTNRGFLSSSAPDVSQSLNMTSPKTLQTTQRTSSSRPTDFVLRGTQVTPVTRTSGTKRGILDLIERRGVRSVVHVRTRLLVRTSVNAATEGLVGGLI